MRIVRRDLVPSGPGSVKMVPVDSDDLWFAYNLIAPGDSVMAVTVSIQRKIRERKYADSQKCSSVNHSGGPMWLSRTNYEQ
ncbi:protein PELOTA 1-like [Mangifera indica]|uniref:protein PELOTA 1-like n=1 Tax=Mangifera indica TaxID=29780 RepID=UPI001CFB5490|nr:protein PELOTA 1-like [Mangifera indica]